MASKEQVVADWENDLAVLLSSLDDAEYVFVAGNLAQWLTDRLDEKQIMVLYEDMANDVDGPFVERVLRLVK